MKNSLSGLKSRLGIIEKKINKLEDIALEIFKHREGKKDGNKIDPQ